MITFSEATLPLSIGMKNPELQDAEEVATNTVVHTAMNGDLRTYRRTPATLKLTLTFRTLTRVKALELRAFVLATFGMILTYADHRGGTWRGKLLVEDLDILTEELGSGRDGIRKEANTIILEFEGTRLS